LSNTAQWKNKNFLNHLKEVDPDAHKGFLSLKTLNEKQSDEMEKQFFNKSVQISEKREEKKQAKKPKVELELGM
jgi:type III secretory pathway component EscR